jgi:hypothetical protein
MSFDKSGLDSYVDVASRMSQFFAKHPDGALQPVDPAKPFEVTTIGDKAFVVYTAAAYRTPDDPRPGIGKATAAIEAAETTEALDVVAKRITEVTDKGLITPNDAVSLRQKLIAKREVIAGVAPDGS